MSKTRLVFIVCHADGDKFFEHRKLVITHNPITAPAEIVVNEDIQYLPKSFVVEVKLPQNNDEHGFVSAAVYRKLTHQEVFISDGRFNLKDVNRNPKSIKLLKVKDVELDTTVAVLTSPAKIDLDSSEKSKSKAL